MSLYVGLIIGLATVVLSAGNACAQGAAGGSLGNDNKSLSGSSEGSRSTTPARRERQEQRASPKREAAPRRREAAPRSGGGGGGGGGVSKFDGIWSVTSVGETCSDTLTTTATISNGRVTSANDTGTISANGVSSSVGNYSGIRVTAQGRSTATSGSGRFQRSDGCVGRWTSSKQ
jgi:hypothetical protein